MTRNDLYEAAFRYKKAGLWKKLWDSDFFAIKLSSGEIGYITIMGKNGEYNGLALYIGDEGFRSLLLLEKADKYDGSEFKQHEMLFQQKCLQMTLGSKDDLRPEELEEVRDYAKKNGIRFAGKNSYPQFLKFEPGCYPWKVKTRHDMEALYEALTVSSLLAEEADLSKLGFSGGRFFAGRVPFIELKDGKLNFPEMIEVPESIPENHKYVKAENQIAVASVKKLKKTGIWEAELIQLMEPVQDEPDGVPYFPFLLLVVDSKSNYVLPVSITGHLEDNYQSILRDFANAWKKVGNCPNEIRCRDERTFALLKDFCDKSNIKTGIYAKALHALDSAEDALLESMSYDEDDEFDQISEIIDEVLSMDKEELASLPKPMINDLKSLLTYDFLPQEIADELKEKFKGL